MWGNARHSALAAGLSLLMDEGYFGTVPKQYQPIVEIHRANLLSDFRLMEK
jgi:hypothetical protein